MDPQNDKAWMRTQEPHVDSLNSVVERPTASTNPVRTSFVCPNLRDRGNEDQVKEKFEPGGASKYLTARPEADGADQRNRHGIHLRHLF